MMQSTIEKFLRYSYRTRMSIFVLGLFLLLLLLVFLAEFFRPALLKVSFYDVGQGDAIFIETPSRYQILIDGGPGERVLTEIAKDMPFYDRTIDLVVATHFDADHIGGLIDILERYQVAGILLPRQHADTLFAQRFLREINEEGALVKAGERSQSFQKIELPGEVEFEILNPREGVTYLNDNDGGIVNLLTYGDIEFLFLADVGKKEERSLLSLLPHDIEVVKAGHHGSSSSSDGAFFLSVSPDITVIQVGRGNRYGHPTQEALKAIAASGSHIWRTDIDGTLTLLSDGKTYWLE